MSEVTMRVFPNARFAKSQPEAVRILSGLPSLGKAVAQSLESVPEEHRDVCEVAAAESYRCGYLADAYESICDLAPELSKSRRRQAQIRELKRQRSRIVVELQAVGIFPTGIAWLLLRWIALPFLLDLLKRWALAPDDEPQS